MKTVVLFSNDALKMIKSDSKHSVKIFIIQINVALLKFLYISNNPKKKKKNQVAH